MEHTDAITAHYGTQPLTDRVAAALGEGPQTWQTLAPLDQFPMRGPAATTELAIPPGATLLDIGCLASLSPGMALVAWPLILTRWRWAPPSAWPTPRASLSAAAPLVILVFS